MLMLTLMIMLLVLVCVWTFSARSSADVGQADSEPVLPSQQHYREDCGDGARLAEQCI